jgi:hypothetical protein
LELHLLESGAFIFYGTERFLDYIPPHKLASINLPNCRLAVILDLVQTNRSFSRQAKLDVLKTERHLSLERPVEMAMLASLAGVKCIYSNQWHCRPKDNADKLQAIFKDLLANAKTTGQAIQLLFDPPRRVRLEEQAAKAKEMEEVVKSASKRGGGKAVATEKPAAQGSALKRSAKSDRDMKKSSAPNVSVKHQEAMSHRSAHQEEEQKEGDEEGDKQAVQPLQSWFSMVCYGLPNLMVMHPSKG